MARRIFLALFGIMTLCVSYFYFFGSAEYEEVYHDQQMTLRMQTPVEGVKAHPVIDAINNRNRAIRSFYCDELNANVQQDGRNRAAKLNGMLAYEKDRKFRLRLNSIVGNELDVGSDGSVFWFWSNRMKPSALYWARFEDLHKTRLKSPFNPHWLSGCLGFDEIEYGNAVIDQSNGKMRVIKSTTNAQNQSVKVVTIIDPNHQRVTGYGLYDANDSLVASAEVQEFYNGYVPRRITFVWHKENAQMIWTFSNPRVNVGINTGNWAMPNYKPVVNMANDHGASFEL